MTDDIEHTIRYFSGLGKMYPYCSCGNWQGAGSYDPDEVAQQAASHLRSMATKAAKA